jgi:predicted metalloprotease
MTLNEGATPDTSQIEDRRGAGGGGGGLGGIPIPLPGGGGGIVGLIILVLLVAGGFVGNSLMDDGGSEGGQGSIQECTKENPDRLDDQDCRNALYVTSIQDYWEDTLPQTLGVEYTPAKTTFFSGAVSTGCGSADSGVGPFYCPADDHVYIDLTFYDQLATQFGAQGQFAQPYVLAHEYGHHIQDITGIEAHVRQQMEQNPSQQNELSVRMELQADCFAGVWAKHATQTDDQAGKPIFKDVSQADIDQALDAAAKIGDDAIQKKMGGGVDESQFTHGSSAQRQRWFNQGWTSGDPKTCDTFTGSV